MHAELLLIPWLAMMILATLSAWRYTWGLPLAEVPSSTPPVAVIVPIKGETDATEAFLRAIRHQDYSDYRIIAAVESEDDPAFRLLQRHAIIAGVPIEICVAGLAQRSGQKVHNLLAALGRLLPGDALVCFTDADTLPQQQWLSRLVSAMVDGHCEAVTGYRWMLPSDGALSSAVVAAANASIVTLLRVPYFTNACWGGTTLLSQATLERIAIRKYWDGAVSDDLQMTRALREHGILIFSPRQSLLPSPIAMDWREAFIFGRRQYRIVLTHSPALWLLAAFITALPVLSLGLALVLLLQGSRLAFIVLALSLLLGEMRTRCRQRILHAMWGKQQGAALAGIWSVDRWLRPVWWGFHALCVFSAVGSRRVSWAGIDYVIRSPQNVEVIRGVVGKSTLNEQPSFAAAGLPPAPLFKQEQPEQPL
jgi:hypothetical protein